MAKILSDLTNTIIAGIVLAIVLVIVVMAWHNAGLALDHAWWAFIFRWLHVLSGVMWIGILWYFNFVQIPNMGKIPDDQKPAVTGVIAPAALFWFRWGAMATIITGLILAWLNGYLVEAIIIGIGGDVAKNTAIGIGMWLGTIMWFNVWFIICQTRRRRSVLSPYPRTRRQRLDGPRCSSHVPTRCCPFPCSMQWYRHRICSEHGFTPDMKGRPLVSLFIGVGTT